MQCYFHHLCGFPLFSQEVEILEFDKENFTIRAVG